MQLRDIVIQVNEKNSAKYDVPLLGLNCSKEFMPSIANIIGTDLTKYKIIRKGEFACSLMQVARDGLVPIRLLEEYEVAIMSSAYFIFKVVNKDVLPEYLMLFFRTKRFDDNAMFYSSGGIRGALSWDRFLDIDVPVPDLNSQKKIVDQYYKIQKAICIKEAINNNLLEHMRIMSIERNKIFDNKIKISDRFNVFTGKKDVNQAKSHGKYRFYSCSPEFLYSDDYICDKESILIAGNGSYTGRVSLAKAPFDLYQRTYSLTPTLEDDFIYYTFAILSSLFKNKVESSLHGSAIPYIVLNDITNFEIPINSNLISKDLLFCKSAVSILKTNIEEILCLSELQKNILSLISQQ